MKAISLWQPWASAVACGAKHIETRSWSTRYRGPLAIHAARREMDYEADLLWFALVGHAGYEPACPFGAFVATCRLVECVPVENLLALGTIEAQFGNYSPGRYAWILENVVPLASPIPYRGRQGLFEIPEIILAAEITK